MKKILVIAGGILLVVVGLVFALQGNGPSVDVVAATQQPIEEYVDEQGKTRLPRTFTISMPFTARVGEIALEEGDPVKADQVVAKVVQEDVQAEFDEAKAAVERLSAAILETADKTVETTTKLQSEYFVESMGNTVDSAKTQVNASKSRLDYAITYLDRITKLFERGAKTEDDFDRAELQKIETETEYQTDVLTYQAIVSINAATKLLPNMITQYIDRKELSVAVLQQEKAEAMARLRTAQLRLQRSQMTSPVDGIVLSKHLTSEQQATAGTVLLEIGQIDQLEVEVEVLSQDAMQIQPGDRAEIFGPSLGKKAGDGIPLTVHRVYPAGFTKVSSLGVEQQRVVVVLRFDPTRIAEIRQQYGLGVEYRVQARIFTADKASALIIPRSSIFRDVTGNWHAMVESDGKLQRRQLKLGLMNDEMVEVVDGITQGEHVLVSPESSMAEGDSVTPTIVAWK